MPKSRRIKPVTTKTGMEVSSAHCRRCGRDLAPIKFHTATDTDIDRNGLMSVCKDCINEMFTAILAGENSIEKTVLKLCRRLNVKYSQEAINATLTHIETFKANGKDEPAFFGIYMSKLHVVDRTSKDIGSVGSLMYEEVTQIISSGNPLSEEDVENAEELKRFWQTDKKEDIEFLENELANFKQSHPCDTYTELVLMREACYVLLDMHKTRIGGNEPKDSSIKVLADLFKRLGISPDMASAASGKKSMDSFGLWLKDISELRPEEWVENKSIYKDVDNIEAYGEKFITSPMRALVTGSREFAIEGAEIDSDGE